MNYKLIGKSLPYSYSKKIHQKMNNFNYDILEISDESSFINYLNSKDYKGLNITIPYKKIAFDKVDIKDDIANKTNVINTIINYQGTLIGYNTDYYGFLATLKKYKIKTKDKVALILGSGATSNTCKLALEDKKIKKVYIVSRNSEKLNYDNLSKVADDIDIIINTTPFNTYPNNVDSSLIDLNKFKKVSVVIDVIYNPINTKLLMDAKEKKIKAINGLYMLVYQAYVSELLFNNKISKRKINKIYKETLKNNSNIVLIGMPSVGKTTIGKKLARKLNMPFIDIDELIVLKIKMSIKDYINNYGEAKFREIEKEIIYSIKDYKGYVIASGGGSILDKDNVFNLACNGKIIYLSKNINKLKISDDRPLIKNKDELKEVFIYRHNIYNNIADYKVNVDKFVVYKITWFLGY